MTRGGVAVPLAKRLRWRAGWGDGLAVLAGALWLAAGPTGAWLLGWIWPALIYVAVRGGPPLRAMRGGATCALLAMGRILTYGWAPELQSVLLVAAAAVGGVLGGCFGAVLPRLPAAARPWAFACGWALADALVTRTFVGHAASPAHDQGTLLPLAQAMALTGFPGLVFLTMLLPAALVECAGRRLAWATAGTTVLAVGLVGFAWGYGRTRLHLPADGPRLTVAIAQCTDSAAPSRRLAVRAQWRHLMRRAREQGAHLVIWPEIALIVTATERADWLAWLGEVSRAIGMAQVVGIWERERRRNTLVAFDATGRLRLDYAKRHPLWLVEPSLAGRDPPGVMSVAGQTIGGAVCFDDCSLDVPGTLARLGARFVAVPTRDWPAVTRPHARLHRHTAIAFGFASARSTPGRCEIVDDRGRVVAGGMAPQEGPFLAIGSVRLPQGPSPYARWGDWFAALAAGGWMLVSLSAAWRWGRTHSRLRSPSWAAPGSGRPPCAVHPPST